MSEQTPHAWPAAFYTAALLLLSFGLIVTGVLRLATAPIGLLLVLWVALPLVGLPLMLWSAYHLHGLLTASYRIDRDGFVMRWGLAAEAAPLQAVRSIEAISRQQIEAPAGLRLPGLLVGWACYEREKVESFAVATHDLLLVELEDSRLIISPADPEIFHHSFVEATRLGSLAPREPVSKRANLLTGRLWNDRVARWLMLIGLLLPLGLIGYLGLRSGGLPEQIPFGFQADGAPGPPAPPGRLLLLALMNGFIWAVNLLLGAWFYRDAGQKKLSYGLWGLSLLVGILFWGAVLQMIGAAI